MGLLLKSAVASLVIVASSAVAANTVGVVNMKTVFTQSVQAKAMMANMKKRFASKKAGLEKMGEALQAQVIKLKKNKAVMTKKQATALQAKIASAGRSYSEKSMSFQKAVYMAKHAMFQAFFMKVKQAAQEVAKSDGLTVVIPTTATVYAAQSINVTKQVLAKLK